MEHEIATSIARTGRLQKDRIIVESGGHNYRVRMRRTLKKYAGINRG